MFRQEYFNFIQCHNNSIHTPTRKATVFQRPDGETGERPTEEDCSKKKNNNTETKNCPNTDQLILESTRTRLTRSADYVSVSLCLDYA